MDTAPTPFHIEQLTGLCRKYPMEPKIVFVPTLQIGHEISSALAASGSAWINLHCTTIQNEARRLAEPMLLQKGWTRLVRDADLFFLEKTLRETTLKSGYFEGQRISSGLLKAFQRTMHALRTAGVPAEALSTEAGPKSGALAALFRKYDAFLRDSALYDDALVVKTALQLVKEGVPSPGVYAIFDETPVAGLAHQFLTELVKEQPFVRIGRTPKTWGINPPDHCAANRMKTVPLPQPNEKGIGAGGAVFSTRNTGEWSRIQTFESLGSENEIREVLRRIVHSGVPLDRVEIAYTGSENYLPLIFSLVRRFELNATFAHGVPVHLTIPGRAILRFFRWILSDFERAGLIMMCQSGLLDFRQVLGNGSRFGPSKAAGFLKGAQILHGRRSYERWFQRREAEYANRGADWRRRDLNQLRSVVEALLGLVPEEEILPVGEWTECGIRFLEQFTEGRFKKRSPEEFRGEIEYAAVESLKNRLAEIGRSVDTAGVSSEILTRLSEILEDHKVSASRPKPGALHVTPLDRAGYSGRLNLFVVGLDELNFPGPSTEDAILLDFERSGLTPELGLLRKRPTERTWHFIRALGMATGAVTLTTNRRNIREDREVYPSPVYSLLKTSADQAAGKGPDSLKPPVSFVPKPPETLDNTELWLALRSDPGRLKRLLGLKYGMTSRGMESENARKSAEITVFDGWVGRTTPELDLNLQPLSASKIQTVAECPYRYFLRYVLGLRPPDEVADDPTRWLDPLQFGSVLHDLFYRFMKEVHSKNEPVSKRHEPLLRSILEKLIEEKQLEVPPPGETAFRADCQLLEQAATIFLDGEIERADDADPWAFELAFGTPPKASSDPWDQPEPVELDFGKGTILRLQGKINRVNRRKDGSFEIWDYKTGSMYDYEGADLLNKGRHIQWALYAYALKEVLRRDGLKALVSRAGYLFPNVREYGRTRTAPIPKQEVVAGILQKLFDLVRDGYFVHTPESRNCSFCDFREVCGNPAESAHRIKVKLGEISRFDDEESALEKWCKWQTG